MNIRIIFLLRLLLPCVVFALSSADVAANSLVVGVKHAPPFVIKGENGQWSGITIELWRRIAEEQGFNFQLREYDLTGLLSAMKNGELDAGIGAITVTATRATQMDFSHPFYTSGLGIALPSRPANAWLGLAKGFFTWQFVSAVLALLFLLLMIGVVVWLFEHKSNQQFGGPSVNGIGSGLWWSAVTMTTVGYGDKAPMTVGGRLVALVWMFASIIIISSFTAAIASSLTVGQLSNSINGPQDLYSVRTGTLAGTSSEEYLKERYINYTPFANVRDGLNALAKGEIDAFVYDQPLLKYLANTEFQGRISVLPNTFRRQDYAIALRQSSPLKESIDQSLLKQLESPAWQKLLASYLGLEYEF